MWALEYIKRLLKKGVYREIILKIQDGQIVHMDEVVKHKPD